MHEAAVMRSSGSPYNSGLSVRFAFRLFMVHFLGQEQEPASHAQELPQAQSQALRGEVICKRSVSYARYLDSTLHAGRMVG